MKNKLIVRMQGRNPEHPTKRIPGDITEQRLEPNLDLISNCLTQVQKDNLVMEKVFIKQATKKGFIECELNGVADLSFPDSKTRRGRVVENGSIAPTLQCEGEICKIESIFRIRKLTPRECFRLMDFDDEDFDAAASVNSNTQLYKQAGNSIVVGVLEKIFLQLIEI